MEATPETKRGKGRPKGTTNRNQEQILLEKAAKEKKAEARKTLGLPERGRLSKENQDKLDEYLK